MTVQGGLCRTWSEPKLLVFSYTGSFSLIIHLFLVVALLVFLLVRYKRRSDPEKYFLGEDLEDDVRENVINYNEEGAGIEIIQFY